MSVLHMPKLQGIQQAYFTVSQRLPVEDIKVKQRLDRALAIVTDYGYNIERLGEDDYIVSKASTSLLDDTSVVYSVSVSECTCPDYATARAGLCKHRMAIMLVVEMEQSNSEVM